MDIGMASSIWGPPTWSALHFISFCYPDNPSDKNKSDYKKFFELLGELLPCKYCCDSYKLLIDTPPTKLDYNILANRETFSQWLYNIHEAINKKLNKNSNLSYEDIKNYYESYRLSCSRCHKIPVKLAKKFIPYAKSKGLESDYYNNLKSDPEKTCKIFNHMQTAGIQSLENGLPSMDELKLIFNLSSNLSENKLSDIIKNLSDNKNNNKKKIYFLTK